MAIVGSPDSNVWLGLNEVANENEDCSRSVEFPRRVGCILAFSPRTCKSTVILVECLASLEECTAGWTTDDADDVVVVGYGANFG